MTKTQPLFRVCWVAYRQTARSSRELSWDAAWNYLYAGFSREGYTAWVEPA